VAKAVEYVLKQSEHGYEAMPKGSFGPMQSHGNCVPFLAEAHRSLTGEKKQLVKMALTRAVKIIIDAQHEKGSWYAGVSSVPVVGDLDATVCQLNALRPAMKAGVHVPKETLDKGAAFIRSCYEPKVGFVRRAPYLRANRNNLCGCTAVALSALVAAGADEGEPWTAGVASLKSAQVAHTGGDVPHRGVSYYYVQYHAAMAMRHVGGSDWRAWYPRIRDALVQPQSGNWPTRGKDGSWIIGGPFASSSSPDFNTACAVMILQMPDSRLADAGK
jgi:hypothetical protein